MHLGGAIEFDLRRGSRGPTGAAARHLGCTTPSFDPRAEAGEKAGHTDAFAQAARDRKCVATSRNSEMAKCRPIIGAPAPACMVSHASPSGINSGQCRPASGGKVAPGQQHRTQHGDETGPEPIHLHPTERDQLVEGYPSTGSAPLRR